MKTNKNDKDYLLQLGQRIKEIRIEKGYSQEQLSFHCDLHRTYIGAVERGEKNLTILSLVKIANALGISVKDILNF